MFFPEFTFATFETVNCVLKHMHKYIGVIIFSARFLLLKKLFHDGPHDGQYLFFMLRSKMMIN